jgi:hypothetical protein
MSYEGLEGCTPDLEVNLIDFLVSCLRARHCAQQDV